MITAAQLPAAIAGSFTARRFFLKATVRGIRTATCVLLPLAGSLLAAGIIPSMPSVSGTNPIIRAGSLRDLPGILQIYNHYVETSHATFDLEPVSVAQRKDWLRQFGDDGPHRLLVAEDGADLCGFAYSARFRSRPAYDVSVETTVYVRRDANGRGVGSRLYESLLDCVDAAGIHRVYAGIALPNAPSVRLHERFGFRHVGTFSEVGFKFGRYWDVAWFERRRPAGQPVPGSC
jgi:phosphinothricin acetyltransferase